MRMHASQIGVTGTAALKAAKRAHSIASEAGHRDDCTKIRTRFGTHLRRQFSMATMQSVEFFDEASEDYLAHDLEL